MAVLADAFVTNPLPVAAFGTGRLDQNRSFFDMGLRHAASRRNTARWQKAASIRNSRESCFTRGRSPGREVNPQIITTLKEYQ